MRRPAALLLALTLMVALGPMGLATPMRAGADSTWVVTSLADDESSGTLRYAIENSNEGDVITFATGLHGTITLDDSLGQLFIVHALTIEGPGSNSIIIDGDGEIRVLAIEVNDFPPEAGPGDLAGLEASLTVEEAVHISGLTFRNGNSLAELGTFDRVGGDVAVGSSTVHFEDCVFEDGTASSGGGLYTEGAYVSLTRCMIRNNNATDSPSGGVGGGLYCTFSIVMADECVLEYNLAEDGTADGYPGFGGGMAAFLSACHFTGCDVSHNAAGDGGFGGMGGGVFTLLNQMLSMTECTISDNVAGSGGGEGSAGGLSLLGSFGPTVLVDSLIANNTAGSDTSEAAAGGGIMIVPVISGAVESPVSLPSTLVPSVQEAGDDLELPLHMVNCTVSGNTVLASNDNSWGGGIVADGGETGATLAGLSFCTVTDNTARRGGGIATAGTPADDSSFEGVIQLKNSIVAGNTALMTDMGNDALGPIASLGGNIVGDAQGWDYSEEMEMPADCGDLIGVDPLLGPLADNGGPTLTHELLPGSPAVDGACDCNAIADYHIDWDSIHLLFPSSTSFQDSLNATVESDQRGEIRPVDGNGDGEERCDIGAVEMQPDILLPHAVADADRAGSTTVGECEQIRVRVVNDGDTSLAIDHMEITGHSAGDFSIVGDPSNLVLLPGHSTEIILRFCPKTPGEKIADAVIYFNDPSQDPLHLTLNGVGLRKEVEKALEPANMSMTYLRVDPMQVLPGQQVTVSANVCNGGEERGSATATLMVNGVAEQSQSVAASGGSCKQVVFAVARAVPGTYQVSVGGMQGQFSVLAPRTVQASVASRQHTGLGTGGLVAIAAVMVVLVFALVYVFRRE
ncbi:MAG: hypothetical protein JW846_08435 [Dehalococcoidia bacterium]|nr:hypothetical protein [Dehalococcoidia bacterium]